MMSRVRRLILHTQWVVSPVGIIPEHGAEPSCAIPIGTRLHGIILGAKLKYHLVRTGIRERGMAYRELRGLGTPAHTEAITELRTKGTMRGTPVD